MSWEYRTVGRVSARIFRGTYTDFHHQDPECHESIILALQDKSCVCNVFLWDCPDFM